MTLMSRLASPVVAVAAIGILTAATFSQSFTENFDTVVPAGWTVQNNSSPIGSLNYFQGNPAVFTSQAGATNSYAGVNFNSGAGTATISDWLISPNRTFKNGDTISFYTRTVDAPAFPDRLQVRLSQSGASTNVGTLATDVGDFSTLLLDINPALTVAGYPNTWTLYTVTLSGLPGSTPGRIAFRYFVANGGPSGANSDYIGIDTFTYTVAAPTAALIQVSGRVLTPDGAGLRNATVSLTDASGQVHYTRTSAFGYYTFADVPAGGSALVSVTAKRFSYDPRVLIVNDTLSGIDLTPR